MGKDFNDTLKIPHYEANPQTISGKQRRGITQSIGPVASYFEHIEQAAGMTFPLSPDTPIPGDLGEALDLTAVANEYAVNSPWREKLAGLKCLASLTGPLAKSWYKETPKAIKPAVGKADVALLSELILTLDIGNPACVSQFVYGFPITGILSQSGVFPTIETPLPTLIEPDAVFQGVGARFRKRAEMTSANHEQYIWDETLVEQTKCWFAPHRQLNAHGSLVNNPNEPCNPTFRFPCVQPDKIRLIGDLKHSEVNR